MSGKNAQILRKAMRDRRPLFGTEADWRDE